MLKRSLLGLTRPKIEYDIMSGIPESAKVLSVPEKVSLLLEHPFEPDTLSVKCGDRVKTGQIIGYSENDEYAVSPVTGIVDSTSLFVGDFAKKCTSITIKVDGEEDKDDSFARASETPGLDVLKSFLRFNCNSLPYDSMNAGDGTIDTIVITCVHGDLLVHTNQFVLKHRSADIEKGIEVLKSITNVSNIVIALPKNLAKAAGSMGASSGAVLKTVKTKYPYCFPALMIKEFVGREISAGGKSEDVGVCVINVEEVADLGYAFLNDELPVNKALTIVKKDGSHEMVVSRIGTPIQSIMEQLKIVTESGDRIIIGGLMTGKTAYSEDLPVLPGMDCLIFQDGTDLNWSSDSACINCGDCIRICPVNVPVNMLVRFLEAGNYEEASDQYDLNSCIECGLCSYVCVSRIPIFQYIKLAKYELDRAKPAEATDV